MRYSAVCKNCICLAVCLNRATHIMIDQCAILSNRIVHFCSSFDGRGNRSTIHLTGIERDVALEIYTDNVYILEGDECEYSSRAISVIRRKAKRVTTNKS